MTDTNSARADHTTDELGQYLQSISSTPLLRAEDEIVLARAIEAGVFAREALEGNICVDASREELLLIAEVGDRARQQFIAANLRLVVSIARKHSRGRSLLDLIQDGNEGLVRAVEKFDYTKGFKFSTYATWWIRQAIFRGIGHDSRTIKLPMHVHDQTLLVSRTIERLRTDLGEFPTSEQIAQACGLSVERVEFVRQVSRPPESLDSLLADDSDTTFADILVVGSATCVEDAVVGSGAAAEVDELLGNLDYRSAEVLRRRFGLFDGTPWKRTEIARDLGVSAERVRQIEMAAMAKLSEVALAGPQLAEAI